MDDLGVPPIRLETSKRKKTKHFIRIYGEKIVDSPNIQYKNTMPFE
jgi:hypothetical protein